MFKLACVTAAALLAASSVSAATFNTFTDRSAFNAATGVVQIEDFNSFDTGGAVDTDNSFNGQDLTVGDLTIRNDSNNAGRGLIDIPPHIFGIFSVDGTANANFVVNKDFNSVVLTFANAVTAFGADFAALNNADELSVEFEVNGERISPPVQGETNVQFFGFTSDMAFTSVSLVGASETSPFDGFAGDNITFGAALEATVVPLPAPAGLLVAALAGMFFVRRRKA